ncbi:PHD finger protein 20 isoform X2 [Plutella xylostella]|nr:PHD finger protein 20 isoform X2 [Plutella xylostella]
MEVDEEVGGGNPPPPQDIPDADEGKDIYLDNSKPTEGENIEAIKKFIEEQEKEILELQAEVKPSTSKMSEQESELNESFDLDASKYNEKEAVLSLNKDMTMDSVEETAMVASDVMNIILSESEAKLAKKNLGQKSPKAGNSSSEKVNSGSMALSVGSRVEAKDFSELWYPAHIAEVDYDEMEVLVHYDNIANKHDEWINVSSPRLRPFESGRVAPAPAAGAAGNPVTVKEEPKVEERAKATTFAVGDRCLARWRDNRRFMATVHAELENGKYEVVFDDGVHWTCGISRLSKMREAPGTLHVDTGGAASPAAPSPDPAAAPTPPYHTHLFDPARDYLGSKSERRERKRKLNIKEIFNIGQKKKKVEGQEKPQRKRAVVKKKVAAVAVPLVVKTEVKTELPDAVAAIIGTVQPEAEPLDAVKPKAEKPEVAAPEAVAPGPEVSEHTLEVTVVDPNAVDDNTEDDDTMEGVKLEIKEELIEAIKTEEFEEEPGPSISDDVMENISRTITKLEDDLVKVSSPKRERSEGGGEREKKKSAKKSKLRLKHEIKVKEEVQKVKSELETMKSELEQIKKRASLSLLKGDKKRAPEELAAPAPGEWCCKWVNGQPVGAVSELDGDDGKGGLPRRSVQVEDTRLPEGWTKHMVRRSLGSSAGKWDVVLVNPDNKRLHTKTDMVKYLETINDPNLKPYEAALLDFGMHRKLAKRLGWDTTEPEPTSSPPHATVSHSSPIIPSRKMSLKRKVEKMQKFAKKKKRAQAIAYRQTLAAMAANVCKTAEAYEVPPLEDGYVYVGSLKVQIIENLLRCPAEGCFKNFRNNTLIKMHIKHYHRELRKELGATPKVSDLASSRAEVEVEPPRMRFEPELKVPKLKISKKRLEEVHVEPVETVAELPPEEIVTTPPVSLEPETPKILDSPKLRNALVSKVIKRPRVLLPVKKSEDLFPDMESVEPIKEPERDLKLELDPVVAIQTEPVEGLDFESEISSYTVSKVPGAGGTDRRKKGEKKKKTFASIAKAKSSEEEEWCANSDVETRLSFPRSGSPDSKFFDKSLGTPQPQSSESTEDKGQHLYMYNEAGERIRIVHMKREEIINCHCGFREEDGLMIQCELCLCWQHALCHNIQKEAEVPEKYTCSICLNPRRGRRSQRFLHDQDRLYEGLLPGARPCETLKRSHELSGNLLRIEDALHALKVKYHVATKKDHPKLYLWAKDWENELNVSADRLTTEYVDLGMMISALGKENLPVKSDDVAALPLGAMATPSSEDPDSERYTPRDACHLGSALLGALLGSPGAALDLPAAAEPRPSSEAEVRTSVAAPQPEAAIENSACRERLLRHIQRCQALIDARLDSIEAQVAELESQDPSFEDDETADYFPRTKQTIQMMLRDLDSMEELGVIT